MTDEGGSLGCYRTVWKHDQIFSSFPDALRGEQSNHIRIMPAAFAPRSTCATPYLVDVRNFLPIIHGAVKFEGASRGGLPILSYKRRALSR